MFCEHLSSADARCCSTTCRSTNGFDTLLTLFTRSLGPVLSFPIFNMADEARVRSDFAGLDQAITMGGHFTRVFGDDLNWRMVPFILIWAASAVVLLVRTHFQSIAKGKWSNFRLA